MSIFAETIGYSQGYLRDIETGKVGPARCVLEKLKEVHGLSADWVLFGLEKGTQLPRFEARVHGPGGKHEEEFKAKYEDQLVGRPRGPSVPNLSMMPADRSLDPDLYRRNRGLYIFVKKVELSPGLLRHELDHLKSIPTSRRAAPKKEFYARALAEYRSKVKKQMEICDTVLKLNADEIKMLEIFIKTLLSSREES